MNKYGKLFTVLLTVLAVAVPALAQPELGGGGGGAAADNASTVSAYAKLAAGIGFGLAAGLAAIGQGRVGAAGAEGAARNPGASGRIQVLMIIGLAFIETLVIFTLVIMYTVVAV